MSKKFFMEGHYQWKGSIGDYFWKIIDLINPQDDDLVLEVGIGKGRYAIPISEVSERVVGGDINQFFISECRSKCDLDLLILDAENLPIRDGVIDKTLCLATMTHIENYENSVRELIRVSKIGGEIVMDIANLLNAKQIFSKLITLVVKIFRNVRRIPFYPKLLFQVKRPFRDQSHIEYESGWFGSLILIKAVRK